MDIFSNVKKYTKDLLNHSSTQNPTKPIILVLLIYALEQIITTKTFYSCPATGHRVYGCLFMFGPSVCFFVLALLLNKSFFYSVTGCYRGEFNHAHVCRRTLQAIRKSTFIAFVWLVLAFANTHIYVCIVIGQQPTQAVLKKMSPMKQDTLQNQIREAKARSTVISWCMFLSAMVFAFFYLTIRRCCFSDPHVLPSLRDYKKLESEAAVAAFKVQIAIIAKEEGEKQVKLSLEKATEEGKTMVEAIEETIKLLVNKYQKKKHPMHNTQNIQANGGPPQNHAAYQSVKTTEEILASDIVESHV